ncbi:hypothetical protein L1D16_18255 [Vibrio sp. Isolate31]|uniref:hypothetical protein n=1 Tax=Vibrio sp. Isolate31 TaxID=2908537 RepID=UPI001EFD7B85|nr:hypothetical protein [Vibrio sp. Isolate31]
MYGGAQRKQSKRERSRRFRDLVITTQGEASFSMPLRARPSSKSCLGLPEVIRLK